MTFAETLMHARQVFEDAGYYPRLEVQLDKLEAARVQREMEVGRMMIDEALHPTEPPSRPGLRFLGRLYDVSIFVRDE